MISDLRYFWVGLDFAWLYGYYVSRQGLRTSLPWCSNCRRITTAIGGIMHCWECGEWLEFEDDFCPECGADPDAGDSSYDELDYDYCDPEQQFYDEG